MDIKQAFKDIYAKKDIRWVLLASLLFYALVLIRNPGFGKSVYHVLIIFSVVTISDLLLNYIVNRRWHLPLSGMTSSIGIILIIYSSQWSSFLIIAVMVALSKYFIRADNLHVFNPNNFAMVFAFIFLSEDVTTTSGRWSFDLTMFLMMLGFGLFISTVAKRVLLSLTFLASFFIFAYCRSFLSGQSFVYLLLPYYSPTFYLFSFYHITDPITTPSNYRGMLIFGILLALIDNTLRSFEILYSPFYAYFILASFQPLFKDLFNRPYNRVLPVTTKQVSG